MDFPDSRLNCGMSVSLEFMILPDGKCRSVSYGVMKIQISVAIVRKFKMGGCEHHYLTMTWAAPIHSKIGSKKSTQKGGRGGLFEPICMVSSTEGASSPEIMNWMHADLQIEVEKRLLFDD